MFIIGLSGWSDGKFRAAGGADTRDPLAVAQCLRVGHHPGRIATDLPIRRRQVDRTQPFPLRYPP
jgi:hypothetical protein